jgi:cell division protein FtsI/penicillin-binding protein 2
LRGIGFEQQFNRFYPEASLAAHLLGFVGKDSSGQDKGYFGLEGYYDRLLRGKKDYIVEIQDALGRPILARMSKNLRGADGNNLKLSIDRSIQFMVEKKLKIGIEKYNASSGMVGIMNPKTGSIIALVSLPSFSPSNYQDYEENLYKNPFISNTYEPGSTFKPLVMSAALDASLVTPQTKCNTCEGSVFIGGFEIHTWNEKYFKDINMVDVIRRSDNTGMVFVAQKLGVDRMISYLEKFGIGQLTDIDLQGEVAPSLKSKEQWYPVDLATAGFGQGISLTPLELLDAFSAIANKGKRMRPYIVDFIEGADGKTVKVTPKTLSSPISEKTAKVMTEILVNAVNKGEAQWTRLKGYRIAGKTGTASIPVEGHYDPEETLASFIGFAPADDPKFSMLVILDKPTTSPYGSETAAPIFFEIARDILNYYGIPPSE